MGVLTREQQTDCARMSWEAEKDGREIKKFTLTYPGLERAEGYEIQNIRTKLVEAEGHRVVGYKLGSTSMRKRQQMGTSASSYGRLFDYMAIKPGNPLVLDEMIHPKIEPEITFFMKKDLIGENVTPAQVMDATDYVVASLEIIDSRFENFKFLGGDVVSDNISGGRFMLSEKKCNPRKPDLELLGLNMILNGKSCGQAAVCEIMGHPARAVSDFLRVFYRHTGEGIRAGQFIMTGGITQSFSLTRGDCVTAHFAELGDVSMEVV